VRESAAFLDSPPTRAALAESPRRPWTREEYHRAARMGLFGPDERLELIGGEVMRKMSPQDAPHAAAIRRCEQALRRAVPRAHDVRVQLPLAVGEYSEPEPDVAVVLGSHDEHEHEHPQSAVLVIEIAESSLRNDRTTKGGLYAMGGIADYWIVNLVDRVVEVHRDPVRMAGQPFGHHHRSVTRHPEAATITPLAAPDAAVRVAELLPRAVPIT